MMIKKAETTPMHLGRLLKEAREAEGYSLQLVAMKMNIKFNHLKLVEMGEKIPLDDYLVDLCNLLHVDIIQAWDLFKDAKLKYWNKRFERENVRMFMAYKMAQKK